MDDGSRVEISEVTLSGSWAEGDVATIALDSFSTKIDVTVGAGHTISDIRDNLVSSFNADSTLSALATASSGTGSGEITITGATIGDGLDVLVQSSAGGVIEHSILKRAIPIGETMIPGLSSPVTRSITGGEYFIGSDPERTMASSKCGGWHI